MNFQDLSRHLTKRFGQKLTLPAEGAPEALGVAAAALVEVAQFCKSDPELQFGFLASLSGVDWNDRIEVVYHLLSYTFKHELVLKVSLDRERPELHSVESVWPTANWHERECYDLLGVNFSGHSDLRRILLPEDWVGHPLRKDYLPPTEYHGMSHTRVDPLQKEVGQNGI
ncbi:MAG: NADH-quinone oxidoreductase subunit C [Planctomycetes bacterium]|nr:NADH-quinone oxidoreductase subunit C [Planctomycetota bacterium]